LGAEIIHHGNLSIIVELTIPVAKSTHVSGIVETTMVILSCRPATG
jgi:hypothetical protein